MKYWQTALAILSALCVSLPLGDDFKTINGKEYKDATVSRVEPDGIVLKAKSGISKLYFTELPNEVQQRFGYDPQKAAVYQAGQNAALNQAQSGQGRADAAQRQTNTGSFNKSTPRNRRERSVLDYHFYCSMACLRLGHVLKTDSHRSGAGAFKIVATK